MDGANQRWRERRDHYRPAGEVIRTTEYEVDALAGDTVARDFVERHHYSGSYPAARYRFGLFRHGDLVGVAVFSHPSNDRALTNVFPGQATDSLELGRFVLLDEVPGNGETWFLGRAFELLRREGLTGVLSFSDPVPRRRADGVVVFPGHLGTIYQAHNGRYLGRSSPRTLHLLPDGTVFSDRAAQKVRSRDRGWRYAAGRLEAFGATPLTETEDAAEWLRRWVAQVTRPLRHPGNHRYAWALNRRVRLPAGGTYPKSRDIEPLRRAA